MTNQPKDLLGTVSGGRLLDVATGSGGFINFLIDGLQDYLEIIGLDSSESGRAAFEEAYKDQPQIHFVQMTADRIDFPADSFDSVCIAHSLHHMENLEQVLAEMLRVLKPGGNFIIYEMYRDEQSETQLTHVYLHHWWAAVDTATGVCHHETFTRQQILDIVDRLDLTDRRSLDFCDLSDDPYDPARIEHLQGVIERYCQRVEGLPQQDELHRRGAELRLRLEQVGVQGASSLGIIGRKRSA